MAKYNVVSADSHLEIAPERWTSRVPVKYRERAPRLIKLPNGGDGIIIEGRSLYVLGLAITGVPPRSTNFSASTTRARPARALQKTE